MRPGLPRQKHTDKKQQEKERKRYRKRAGIEPVIEHLKSDYRLDRNFLKGFIGDQINLLMAAAAFNFKKWLRLLFLWLKNIYRILFLHWAFHPECRMDY